MSVFGAYDGGNRVGGPTRVYVEQPKKRESTETILEYPKVSQLGFTDRYATLHVT